MIQIKNLGKTYVGEGNHFTALSDVNLTINFGDFVSIMGKSGCGKTTLLNILGCVDSYTEGSYIFCGQEVNKLSASALAKLRRDKMGYIYQSFNLIEELTCEENVALTMGYAGVPARERKKRTKELLEQVGLIDKAKNHPSQLSGGQRQRVAIARALSNHPELILADEPTGNLDYANGLEIMDLLVQLNHEGTTIVMVTHDEEFSNCAKIRYIMKDGHLSFY